MTNIPAGLFDLATEELANALEPLSQQQIDAIYRIVIVERHTAAEPPAPYRLLYGDDKIVSAGTWARRPRFDPETGEQTRRPGWTHQPAFMAALNLAKRSLRRHQARTMIDQIDQAYAESAAAAAAVTRGMIEIATDTITDPETGEIQRRGTEDRDRISAAKMLAPQWEALRKESREQDPAANEQLADWIGAVEDLDDE